MPCVIEDSSQSLLPRWSTALRQPVTAAGPSPQFLWHLRLKSLVPTVPCCLDFHCSCRPCKHGRLRLLTVPSCNQAPPRSLRRQILPCSRCRRRQQRRRQRHLAMLPLCRRQQRPARPVRDCCHRWQAAGKPAAHERLHPASDQPSHSHFPPRSQHCVQRRPQAPGLRPIAQHRSWPASANGTPTPGMLQEPLEEIFFTVTDRRVRTPLSWSQLLPMLHQAKRSF